LNADTLQRGAPLIESSGRRRPSSLLFHAHPEQITPDRAAVFWIVVQFKSKKLTRTLAEFRCEPSKDALHTFGTTNKPSLIWVQGSRLPPRDIAKLQLDFWYLRRSREQERRTLTVKFRRESLELSKVRLGIT
jgi:hypothetical protein